MGGDREGKVDPPSQFWDFFVTGLIGIACIPFIFGNIVLLWNRKYRPIKTKSVLLTVVSSVGGLLWVVATIVIYGHMPRKQHSIWALCSLWTFWFQACFGFSLWLNCLNVRLIILYYIFVLKKGAKRTKHILTILLILLFPTIVFCIFGSVLHPLRFERTSRQQDAQAKVSPPPQEGNCRLDNKFWSFGLLSFLVLYFLIFPYLAFKLRSKAMAQYNEFRLIRNGGVMSLFLLLLSLVTMQTQAYLRVVGRSFLSLSVAGAVFYYFWARNAEVISNVIFRKEEYERKFNEEMNRCPSERDSTDNFPPSFQNLETDLKEARESINCYDNQIKQLEEEISTMEQRISDLQEQVQDGPYLLLEVETSPQHGERVSKHYNFAHDCVCMAKSQFNQGRFEWQAISQII